MAFQDTKKEGMGPARGGPSGPLTAFIDQGSEFSGKLSFKDTVRIDGKLEGEISSDNTLIVGETGEIHADIRSEIVIVSGEVKGDIAATRQLTLHKTARVSGNINTASLLVEEGAVVNGSIEMNEMVEARSKGAQAQPPSGKKPNSEANANARQDAPPVN